MTRVSLINPSFVAPVVAVAIMLLALTVLRRSPSWRQRLVLTTGLVVALICGVAAAVAVFRFTEYRWPWSFYAWAGLAVFAILTVPIGCSGVRMLATLVNELERSNGRLGLQTTCDGDGTANRSPSEPTTSRIEVTDR